jgi:hypothetical protein
LFLVSCSSISYLEETEEDRNSFAVIIVKYRGIEMEAAVEGAHSVYHFIERTAEKVSDGIRWKTIDYKNNPQYHYDVFNGCGGISLFLAEYFGLTDSTTALDLAIGANTIVRNPYEIQASGWYFKPVIKSDDNQEENQTYAEQAKNWVRPKDQPIGQKEFIEWAGISQILYFEHLPKCLSELPFVDPDSIPPYPHMNAGGYRPSGDFFKIMEKEDEEVVWNGSKSDFEFLGYERYSSGAPETPNKSLQGAANRPPLSSTLAVGGSND